MVFVEFTMNANGHPKIAVNAEAILYIQPTADGHTMIFWLHAVGVRNHVTIKHSYDEVLHMLRSTDRPTGAIG